MHLCAITAAYSGHHRYSDEFVHTVCDPVIHQNDGIDSFAAVIRNYISSLD